MRLDDSAVIPADTGNRDWMAYQAWLLAGNKPDPEFSAGEIAAQAAEAVEVAAIDALAVSARADAVFQALKTATAADISAHVNNTFPLMLPAQRNDLKLLLVVAAAVLRRGVI